MGTQITLSNTNFAGFIADITFSAQTGGTISFGSHLTPYTVDLDYYYGTYDLCYSAFNVCCEVTIESPSIPSDIPDLYQWYDASYSENLTTRISGSQTFVESWTGRSGGYVMTQTTAANQPQLVSGAYGLPFSGVSFSGGSDFMTGTTGNVSIPTGNTVFCVVYQENAINQLLFDIQGNDGNFNGAVSYYVNFNVVEMKSVGGRVSHTLYDLKPKYPRILGAVSGDSISRAGTLNDIPQSSTASFSASSQYQTVRMSTVNGDAPSNGTIYELIIYNRKLTQSEVNDVVSYLKTKWNYNSW